ncbi:acylphosphatase [Ensifer sp. 22564]|uniref:acylphosphatase n=1 Tax=Ensifer sp. 22564 TaxID=3453943 RepID=UPI003F8355D5
MSETSKTALVRILGRVQGVSFRVWARDEAQKLGLVGWVRNEADGSVAALISGPEEAITLMLERLHEGPPAAWVSKVVAEFVEAPEGVSGFLITR